MESRSKEIESLAKDYLRTRSKQVEEALCDWLVVPVRRSANRWARERGMQAHTREDFVGNAIYSIPFVVMSFDGRGSLLKYTIQKTRREAIDSLRHTERSWLEASTICWDFTENELPMKDTTVSPRIDSLLQKHLSCLSDRERFVVEEVYLRGRMQKDVAMTLGVHASRTCQIIRRAFQKIRQHDAERKMCNV